jgi:ATP-dependent Clp protease protease subunit
MDKERSVYIFEDITEELSEKIIKKLIKLENENEENDINLYISSFGGSIISTFAIYDFIQNMKCKVNTIAIGKAMSGASVLLMGGTGKRLIYPNTRIMIHEVSAGYGSEKITDINIKHKESMFINDTLINLYSKHTKKTKEEVKKELKRNRYMSAKEAVEYGLADEIL